MLRTVLMAALAGATLARLGSTEGDSPPRRAHHAMVYDAARGVVLMTGGSTPLDGGQRFQFFNDIWALGDSGWQLLGESGERLSGIGIAYDGAAGRVVSFGGFNGQPIGDVRRLEGTAWNVVGRYTELSVAEPGFAHDARRKRFVAFGGSAGPGQTSSRTTEFDGVSWTSIDIAGPDARQAHAMVYDMQRGRTVLFGGMGAGPPGRPGPVLGDTWEYDGSAWTRREVEGPAPRQAAGVTYDSKRGLVILFGGLGERGFLGDTWSWDGTRWQLLATTGPEPRAMGYLAYDARRDRVVMFGGRKGWPDGDLGDTWVWDGAVWRQIAG